MPAVNLSPIFNGWQGFTAGGLPLAGGLLWTYQSGTSTLQATYTTSAGTVANTNPIVLGSDGRPPQEIWLIQGQAYRFTLLDAASNPVGGPYDNIYSDGGQLRADLLDTSSSTKNAGLIAWLRSAVSAVATTVGNWLGWQDVDPFEFMTAAQIADVQAGAFTLDVTAAVQAAINTGKTVRPKPGTYRLNSGLTGITQHTFRGSKRARAVFKAGAAMPAMLSYPSGVYSGVTVAGVSFDGNNLATRCLEIIGSSQGAVDQIILKDVQAAGATAAQIYLENLTYSELDHVLSTGGTYALHMKTCFTSTAKNCVSYNGSTASVFTEGCSGVKLTSHALFNDASHPSTSLLKHDGGHGNIYRECTFEAQGVANVTQEVLINDTVAGNCTDNAFIDCEFIGLSNTKTRCMTIGASGTIFKLHIDGCRFIKPAAESLLVTSQAEMEISRSCDLVTYDTPTFAAVSVLNNSGNEIKVQKRLGEFSSLSTDSTVAFPAVQTPSADPYTLDDYREYLGSGLAKVALTITGSTTNPTTLAAAGGFNADVAVKVGRVFRLKHNFGAITWAAPGTGNFQINLPFSINGMAHVQGTLFGTAIVGEINGTVLSLYAVGSGTALTWAVIAASGASLIVQIDGIATA